MQNLFLPSNCYNFPMTEQDFRVQTDEILRQSWEQIQSGYQMPVASTGIPMANLHGAAYTNALLSNIGKPLNDGGSGMYGGYQTVMTYITSQAMLYGYNLCLYHQWVNNHYLPENQLPMTW